MALIHEALTQAIIGAAIEVHTRLGPGLLESAYKVCLAHELRLRGLTVATEVAVDIAYKGLLVPAGYRMDMVVADAVVVEIKAVEVVASVHERQLLTYLRLSGYRAGLLLNFNVPRMKDGVLRRVV